MFTFPEDLSKLSRDELLKVRSEAFEHFDELKKSGNEDSETVAAMTSVADGLERAQARLTELDQQADAMSRIDALRPNETAKSEPVEEPVEQPLAQPDPQLVEPAAVPTTTTTENSGELVTASARNRTVADVAATQTPSVPPAATTRARGAWHRGMTAGAELNGVPAGAEFSSGRQMAEALKRRTQSLVASKSSQPSLFAQMNLDVPGDIVTQSTGAHATSWRIVEAIDEYRAKRGALTAAGFCGPCETIMDFCEPEVADQLITLPTIGIGRGCIEYFPAIDFSTFDDYIGEFCQPELEAGVEKPCPEIPCIDPVREEACVVTACAQADIISNWTWPELVERHIRGLLVRQQIRIHKATLARMEEGSDPVTYPNSAFAGYGFTAALLAAIEVQAEDIRADSYLGADDVVRVILDRWVRGAIRADLANRTGVDLLSVTNERISSLFAERGVVVTWVKNWQDNHIGQPGSLLSYPDSVKFLIFRDGSWVRGLETVIDLNTIYDHELLVRNKYTRLFTEQALIVLNMCGDSRVVELPVCPSGVTAMPQQAVCFSEEPSGDGEDGCDNCNGDDGEGGDGDDGDGGNGSIPATANAFVVAADLTIAGNTVAFGPLVESTPDNPSNSAANLSTPLGSIAVAESAVGSAWATVGGLDLGIGTDLVSITAEEVTANNENGQKSVTLTGLNVTVAGMDVNVPVNPAPNTEVSLALPGPVPVEIGSLILNAQSGDTVTAVTVSLLDGVPGSPASGVLAISQATSP